MTTPLVVTTKQKVADIAERAAWTLLQAGIGEAVIGLLTDRLPAWAWLAPLVAALLAVVKGTLAAKFSANGTASTLPLALDTPPQPTIDGDDEPVIEPQGEIGFGKHEL